MTHDRPFPPRSSRGAVVYTLVVEGQKMFVRYTPNWTPDHGQFEFRSLYHPPRRIPLSETGYLCHFASMDDVKAARTPQAYAREVVLAALAPCRSSLPHDSEQLSLFT